MAGHLHLTQTSVTLLQTSTRRCGRNKSAVPDTANLKQYNNGNTFLLTVIDVFSKKAWIVPLKNKSGSSLTTAFRRLLKDNDGPQSLQTDQGKEFLNREFQELLKD